jgi:hypothetical protein
MPRLTAIVPFSIALPPSLPTYKGLSYEVLFADFVRLVLIVNLIVKIQPLVRIELLGINIKLIISKPVGIVNKNNLNIDNNIKETPIRWGIACPVEIMS